MMRPDWVRSFMAPRSLEPSERAKTTPVRAAVRNGAHLSLTPRDIGQSVTRYRQETDRDDSRGWLLLSALVYGSVLAFWALVIWAAWRWVS